MILTCQNVSGAAAHTAEETTSPFPGSDAAAESAISQSLDTDHPEAAAKANDCEEYHRLTTTEHLSGNQASVQIGRSPAWFSINVPKWRREGAAAFLPKRRELGADRKLFLDLPDWFVPACKFFWLLTNHDHEGGSIPAAIRRSISLPVCAPAVMARLRRHLGVAEIPTCPAAIKDEIVAREKAGKDMLPESITKQIPSNKAVTRQYRNPKGASLDYVNAPGTAMWLTAPNGERVFIRPGMVVEGDDATINFPCVIPWEIGGCDCSEKFRVKVGRFQWLVFIDVGSRMVLGFSYTARPKSSYRAEDITSAMKGVVKQHGIPDFFRLERGSWESNLVKNAVKNMGSQLWTVFSPHSKPFIEGLFNSLWAKLSVWFPDSEVGRFRGENERASKLLTACQAGHQDPRKYFPPLQAVLEAFHAVIAEHNAHIIRSQNYGKWIPQDRWNAEMDLRKSEGREMRRLDPANDWMFTPFVREWSVRGNTVGGQVKIMDGMPSVPFQFSAPFLPRFAGVKVRAYFDPSEPRCAAKIALAQPYENLRVGSLLGDALQVNETTQYMRLVFGFGDDARDAGMRMKAQAQSALRREVRATVGRATPNPYRESEARDGVGRVTRISSTSSQVEGSASQECDGDNASIIRNLAGDFTARCSENPGVEDAAGLATTDPAETLQRERPELFV